MFRKRKGRKIKSLIFAAVFSLSALSASFPVYAEGINSGGQDYEAQESDEIKADDASGSETQTVKTDDSTDVSAETKNDDANSKKSDDAVSDDEKTNTTDEKTDGESAAGTGTERKVQTANASVLYDGPKPSVVYNAHVQNIGWQSEVADGADAGTTGKSLRMEAVKIRLNSSIAGSVVYRAHVQNIGWQSEVADGAESGTDGKSLRVEALQIHLTGEISEKYDIYYRVHAENFGWLGWASNGRSAGTAGHGLRLEAIEIRLIAKGQPAPGSTARPFVHQMISAKAHVQNIGWMSGVGEGDVCGTTGRGLQVEALRLSLDNPDTTGSIQYSAHISNIGWEKNSVADGQTSGTTGRGLGVEAVKINLTGDMAERYNIWYRVHVANLGWLGWTSNGNPAGTTGFSLHVQALQIVLSDKSDAAPGSTADAFLQPNITYSVYDKNTSSWTGDAANGAVAGKGTTGNPIQGLKVSCGYGTAAGSVEYRSHISNVGWESAWTASPNADGKPGQNNTEAVSIKLTGHLSSLFDVYYSVYSEGFGWLGWAANGANAGTKGFGSPVTGIRISLVIKGCAAPGSTARAFIDKATQKVIVLDPGHDSAKPGAHGGGLHEEELTLKIAQYCKEELERYGVPVYMTRSKSSCPIGTNSSTICLKWRVDYAARQKAAYLVSLHLNAASSSGTHGAAIMVQHTNYNVNNVHQKSMEIGRNILNELNGIGIPTSSGNGLVERWSGDENYPDGSVADYYAILRHAKEKGMPAVIVEHCYLSNSGDRGNFLSDERHLRMLGAADARGILKTIGLI